MNTYTDSDSPYEDRRNDTVHKLGKATTAEVQDYVKSHWPEAKHEGVGHWRIPRTAHITSSGNNSDANGWYTTLRYSPMR